MRTSDVVVEADASLRGCLEAENIDASAASVFHWIAWASEKQPRLVLNLTALVSSWLIWLMGKPHKTQILAIFSLLKPLMSDVELPWVNPVFWLMGKPRKTRSDG